MQCCLGWDQLVKCRAIEHNVVAFILNLAASLAEAENGASTCVYNSLLYVGILQEKEGGCKFTCVYGCLTSAEVLLATHLLFQCSCNLYWLVLHISGITRV